VSVLSVSLRICVFEGEDLRGDIGSCVAESLSTMVSTMALGFASARPRRTYCAEFSEASSTAIFVDSISHRRPPGQPVSANSRSRLDEHPVTLCGVAVRCASGGLRRTSAVLGYLALGGHLRDPSLVSSLWSCFSSRRSLRLHYSCKSAP
jgi:hypothetical protein